MSILKVYMITVATALVILAIAGMMAQVPLLEVSHITNICNEGG